MAADADSDAWHAIFKINFIYFGVWGFTAMTLHATFAQSASFFWHGLLSCGLASAVAFAKGRAIGGVVLY